MVLDELFSISAVANVAEGNIGMRYLVSLAVIRVSGSLFFLVYAYGWEGIVFGV